MSYSIKDLEHLSGIKAHTLRIWEQRYNILKPNRTDSNIRLYDDEDLKLVLNISLLNDNGYKISKIANMSTSEMSAEVFSLIEKNYKFPDQIQALTIAMVDLEEERFEKVINTNVLHHGFEKTMVNIIFPFLIRVGYLWQTGAINPAQEHFITFLIRQKLIVAIDGQIGNKKEDGKKFMLYLPEGELHELSLLFASFIIRSRGHKCIYLGQSLPVSDVHEAYKIYKPDYLFLICTTTPNQTEIQGYLNTLGKLFTECQILLTGYQVVGQDLEIADNMEIIPDITRMVNLVETVGFEN
jgi:MerR family transcriptional regulator, light-induced transcriptional regulator